MLQKYYVWYSNIKQKNYQPEIFPVKFSYFSLWIKTGLFL